MAISINKIDPSIQQQIIKAYQNNISLREIERQFGVTRSTTAIFLEQCGIKTIKGNHYKKYNHNIDFFEDINTEEKAYWLGFMFADGYIIGTHNKTGEEGFGLTLAQDSLDSIQKFKRSIQATNPILIDNSKIKYGGQLLYKITMRSQKTVNDLIDKGCFRHKSLILKPPTKVPQHLIYHFIRGFFDGDGSLMRCQKENIINFSVDFTTTYDMAIWLQNQFHFGTVFKEKRRESTWYYGFGGNLQIIKFYHLLYDNATVWMDRKYARFQELLQKYSEN